MGGFAVSLYQRDIFISSHIITSKGSFSMHENPAQAPCPTFREFESLISQFSYSQRR